MSQHKGILERLKDDEVVIGDGGFVFALEKRGYVKAGPWTPEVVIEHPEAVLQLHREFARAGSDIMQAFTFYASDDKLENRGNDACATYGGAKINKAACELAREVAQKNGGLFLGGICQTPTYLSGVGKEATKETFRKQVKVFKDEKVDFILCEYFEHIEEAEWAVETCKEYDVVVAVTMCIGPLGDLSGVSTKECGRRMAATGAEIVGINCHHDPFVCLDGMKLVMEGVKEAGLTAHYMVQPLGFMTPDTTIQGFIDLPEFPFALEPRICTRFEMARFARQAYDMGIRVIGGCCGFEPYHIRACCEELQEERGKLPEASQKHIAWGGGLLMHTKPWVRARANREYWRNINPSSGRPFCATMSMPDAWGVTAGHEFLKQQKEETKKEEIEVIQVMLK